MIISRWRDVNFVIGARFNLSTFAATVLSSYSKLNMTEPPIILLFLLAQPLHLYLLTYFSPAIAARRRLRD